jgi:predicted HTH transcriptional regulator
MNTQELEEKLEAGVETPGLDYKGPCDWNSATFAKDILALSNVQDGGYIIIGVEELTNNTFARRGVSAVQRDSFEVDKMRDQLSSYADPHVKFNVAFVKDKAGLEYVAIKVLPFDEVPVICSRESGDTHKATIYYRNRDRRVESAPVSNAFDLRDIVERAAVKMMQRMRGLGLTAEPSVQKKLDEELEGL